MSLFKRGTKASRSEARQNVDALPDGLWTKCPECNEILFKKELEKNLYVCNKCGHHYKLGAWDRVQITVDDGTFSEINGDLESIDPLGFPEYANKLAKGEAQSGLKDPMVTGTGEIGGYPVVLGVADFRFMAATMGGVHGEKIVRAMELAIEKKLPVILFTASGGARMQEGMLALMQMPKTCAACAQLHKAGLPYIVVFTDPTMAGVLASYASVGDFIFSEPGAKVGLAGQRVGAQAQVVHYPENFQKAEFQLEHGMIDRIISRREMKSTLIKVLEFCVPGKEE